MYFQNIDVDMADTPEASFPSMTGYPTNATNGHLASPLTAPSTSLHLVTINSAFDPEKLIVGGTVCSLNEDNELIKFDKDKALAILYGPVDPRFDEAVTLVDSGRFLVKCDSNDPLQAGRKTYVKANNGSIHIHQDGNDLSNRGKFLGTPLFTYQKSSEKGDIDMMMKPEV